MYEGERLNSITHLVGATAALAGLVLLVYFAALQGDPVKIVSLSVYGASLFLLYLFSVLYHSFRGKWKILFQKLDHVAIYLLIAGTYTPFTLIALEGTWGWWLFGIIWFLAVAGVLIDTIPKRRPRALAVVIYVLMGWLCLVAVKPLVAALSPRGFYLLLAGGVFYTSGIIFYVFDHVKAHFHGIWHLFVLAGSICHYLAILLYVTWI
jgi:hemolysin III